MVSSWVNPPPLSPPLSPPRPAPTPATGEKVAPQVRAASIRVRPAGAQSPV